MIHICLNCFGRQTTRFYRIIPSRVSIFFLSMTISLEQHFVETEICCNSFSFQLCFKNYGMPGITVKILVKKLLNKTYLNLINANNAIVLTNIDFFRSLIMSKSVTQFCFQNYSHILYPNVFFAFFVRGTYRTMRHTYRLLKDRVTFLILK